MVVAPHRLSALLFLALFCSCGDKLDPGTIEEDIPATQIPDTGGGTTPGGGTVVTPAALCGTTATTITYTGQAKAVIDLKCSTSSCHGGAIGPTMTNVTNSKAGMSGGGLAQIDAGSMPRGTTLTTNQKCILEAWASGGYAD